MSEVMVAVKVLEHAEGLALPHYATALSAGCDLRAAIVEPIEIAPLQRVVVPTGLCVALPAGTELQIRPRSGLAVRQGLTVLNAPGTIDADYRGEIQVPLINLGSAPVRIERGDRIAQGVLAPVVQIRWKVLVDLDETTRGDRGFGSTGRS
ncbi:MAG: dUTP diphosphatase [Deltaproteobacteria bacterium]|nr:MAG: dUTP diphosphatase [Deltaproteobacteria bacterium]